MEIGFIGLGIMGAPLAGHLQVAGHELFLVRNRAPLPEDLLAAGAVECVTAREVAERSEIVILMLPDTPDVDRVLFGPDGVAAGLDSGKTVIDMSSIDPIETKGFGERIGSLGCDYVDAPVSGGEVGARNAELTIMVGANKDVFARVLPLLQLMGKNITLVGPIGSGQIAKVANQIIVALSIEAISEALVFASKAGADPARVRAALMGGFASSRILEVHGQRMIERNFDPGFRIELHQKDLALALASARALSLALPNTASTQQIFSACAAKGGGGWDHSALVRVIEDLADHRLARES